jgi:hypothetical protein
MSDHSKEIHVLGEKITALSDALAKLGSKDDFQKLIKIIRFPGWTTPAELAFASAIVDHMAGQARGLADLKGKLLGASEAVGREQAT